LAWKPPAASTVALARSRDSCRSVARGALDARAVEDELVRPRIVEDADLLALAGGGEIVDEAGPPPVTSAARPPQNLNLPSTLKAGGHRRG